MMRNIIIQAGLFLATLAILLLIFQWHRDDLGNWLIPVGLLIGCIPMAVRWVVLRLGGPDIAVKPPKNFKPK